MRTLSHKGFKKIDEGLNGTLGYTTESFKGRALYAFWKESHEEHIIIGHFLAMHIEFLDMCD